MSGIPAASVNLIVSASHATTSRRTCPGAGVTADESDHKFVDARLMSIVPVTL